MAAPDSVAELVRWFWIPEWDIAPGRTSRQHLVSFPASNLVVQPDLVMLSGPQTRASHRDLTGRGWAVGALLRPAATPSFTEAPADLRDTVRPFDAPELQEAVVAAMTVADRDERHAAAVDAFSTWLDKNFQPATDQGRQANDLADLLDGDATVRTLDDAAARLHLAPRTVQRLATRYVGLSPVEMIRRRRLQEAAQRVRTEPGVSLAGIATELGYADHGHLTREFRERLGFTPSGYRAEAD
ncbi:helix-turn-helix transcriptional regulator [Hamadaea sp.]|uniref:helix-turn-helix transcriptional regulator n=1 Tax=Hamadaea sp. TaxID=2024425 RepID=UPI0025BFF871|nr:helix-turn-helix transcriptional regulator [Hamadaea sp.]